MQPYTQGIPPRSTDTSCQTWWRHTVPLNHRLHRLRLFVETFEQPPFDLARGQCWRTLANEITKIACGRDMEVEFGLMTCIMPSRRFLNLSFEYRHAKDVCPAELESLCKHVEEEVGIVRTKGVQLKYKNQLYHTSA